MTMNLFGGMDARPLPFELCIELSPDILALIERPSNGEGGFQTLMAGLKSGLRKDAISKKTLLLMSEATMARVFRYSSMAGGDGGFEGRLEPLAKVIRGARERLIDLERQGDKDATKESQPA